MMQTIIHEDGVEVRIAPKDVQFQSAKLWQRMLTNFAGPMNNFILAFVLFTGLVFCTGWCTRCEYDQHLWYPKWFTSR